MIESLQNAVLAIFATLASFGGVVWEVATNPNEAKPHVARTSDEESSVVDQTSVADVTESEATESESNESSDSSILDSFARWLDAELEVLSTQSVATPFEGVLEADLIDAWWSTIDFDDEGAPVLTPKQRDQIQRELYDLVASLRQGNLTSSEIEDVEATIIAKTALLEWARTGNDPREAMDTVLETPGPNGRSIDDVEAEVLLQAADGFEAFNEGFARIAACGCGEFA